MEQIRKPGIIGGMGPSSTTHYYEVFNKRAAEVLGEGHNMPCSIESLDLQEVADLIDAGEWAEVGHLLASAAQRLEASGADFIVIASNTVHKVASEVEAAVAIPLLHIADPVVDAAKKAGVFRVGLLGTRTTVTDPFLIERLERGGLTVDIPSEETIERVHEVIFKELVGGKVSETARGAIKDAIYELLRGHAKGVVLGCTELEDAIVGDDRWGVGGRGYRAFPTAELHAESAAAFALEPLTKALNKGI